MEQVQALIPLEDPQKKLPFVQETLSGIRSAVGNQATVLGFVGTPWTLAAYSVEGKADKWASCILAHSISSLAMLVVNKY